MNYLKICALFLVLLLVVSCQHCIVGDNEDQQKALGALRNLSKTMEACYKYDNPSPKLQGRDLLNYCTQHNPRLRRFFDNFTVKSRYDQGYAIVLICSKDGSRWLMEDMSCTSKMDKPPSEKEVNRPCVFTLEAKGTCPQLLKRH